MRIDLEHSDRRPWYLRLALSVVNVYVGIKPGPLLAYSYDPRLFDTRMLGYLMRGTSRSGPWSKGETELFAAFVSKLNSCQF